MATGLKYYFGIDFGTTNSATVGYVVMDQNRKPLNTAMKKDVQSRPLLRLIRPLALCSMVGMHGIKRWN